MSSVSIIGYLVVILFMTAIASRWLAEEIDISYDGTKEVSARFSSPFKQLSVSAVLVLVSLITVTIL